MKKSPPAAGAGASKVWPPRVLDTIYKDRLQTLYDLLLHLLTRPSSNGPISTELGRTEREAQREGPEHEKKESPFHQLEAKEAERLLIREDDPLEYTTMLKKSYAVMPGTAPTLGSVSFEQRWTQQQIVERVIELQFRQEAKPSHVLCSGYRKLRPSPIGSSRRRAPVGLECLYGNAAVDIVSTDNWRLLLSRVGDLVMLHLLSHAAIFTPLPNDCLLQISGVPISSSVSVFRKSSLLHTGEKMLRSHAKRKRVLQTLSAQPKRQGTENGKTQFSSEGPSPCKEAAGVENPPHVFDPSCESCDDSVYSSKTRSCERLPFNSNAVENNVERSLLAQTSCVISNSHRAKRKAQERTAYRDSELVPTVENHSPDTKKRRKLETLVTVNQVAENCWKGVERTTKRPELPLNGSEGHSHQQTRNSRPPINDRIGIEKAALRSTKRRPEEAIEREQLKIIPISTPRKISTETDVRPLKDARRDFIRLTETPLSKEDSFLGAEVGSGKGESCPCPQKLPDSSRTKRVRLPSWKRRKLQRQDLPLQNPEGHIQGGARINPVERLKEPKGGDKDSDETSHGSSHAVSPTLYVSQASGTATLDGSSEATDKVQEKTAPTTEPIKVPQSREGKKDYSDILNKTKPDEAGADHLHAAIFGSLKSMPAAAGSSTNPTSFVDTAPTRSNRMLFKQLLARAKRCAYGQLLNRHCPLPQELNSQLAESSTPFLTAATAPLLESQELSSSFNDSTASSTRGAGSTIARIRHALHCDYTFVTNGSQISQRVVDKHEPENLEQHTEVEEMMKLLLGPMYQPSGTRISKPGNPTGSIPEVHAGTIPRSGEFKSRDHNKRFEAEKHEKDRGDATRTADFVATDKALRAGLIASYTDHCSVVGFLWAACRSIIPPDILGSKRSWRILRSRIAHFVGLRRHEKFNVQQALFKLKLSSYPWLNVSSTISESTSKVSLSTGERALQQKKLELWLFWLFTSLVVPLIRSHFYVTEIENHRQNVFYYRKPVWAKLRNRALKDLTQRNYKKLSKKSVVEALEGKALGFSQVRLLPKRTGVRPIANLAAPSQGTLKYRVKSERRPTLRQLFGDVEKATGIGQGESMIDLSTDSGFVGDKAFVDSFKDSSPQKAWKSPGFGQSHVPTSTTSYHNSPKSSTVVPASFGGGSKQTTPVKDVIPDGGFRNFRAQRKSLKKVNYSFRSVNSVLRDAYFCLKLEKDSYPDDLGSSVFGYSDIHSKVLPFILQTKASSTSVPRLYMVVCDVTKAYDTIQQEKLQEIVSEYMRSFDYNVAKYACVTPTLASVRVSHSRAPTRACEHQAFTHLAHDLATKHAHCIFTDQGLCTNVHREKILVLLEEHLKHNIVQVGKQFYQQTVGIPQGSILSSILCSLFYGHFELHRLMPHLHSRLTEKLLLSSKHSASVKSACGLRLPRAEILATQTDEMDVENMLESSFDIRSQDPSPTTLSNGYCSCPECRKSDHNNSEMPSSILKNSILLRLIDDSFFISTSEAAATLFVESMHMGSDEYGCHANKRKTAASFSLQLGKRVLPKKIYTTEDGACFMRWSGLLINCYTMEFQADYTRYSGEHIRSTLTVKRERNQGWHLVLKMCQYMRPKCHALFFDPRINSPATIRLNAFQSFLLCAMKFHAYICCLPPVTEDNQQFLYEVVCCSIRYTYGLLRHRMETVGAKAVEYFPFVELEWLAMVAFHRILKRKQSRYRMLLPALQTQLEKPKYRNMTSCSHLSSATDEKRSSMFKYIKY